VAHTLAATGLIGGNPPPTREAHPYRARSSRRTRCAR
jgi:hypothetical protein